MYRPSVSTRYGAVLCDLASARVAIGQASILKSALRPADYKTVKRSLALDVLISTIVLAVVSGCTTNEPSAATILPNHCANPALLVDGAAWVTEDIVPGGIDDQVITGTILEVASDSIIFVSDEGFELSYAPRADGFVAGNCRID